MRNSKEFLVTFDSKSNAKAARRKVALKFLGSLIGG